MQWHAKNSKHISSPASNVFLFNRLIVLFLSRNPVKISGLKLSNISWNFWNFQKTVFESFDESLRSLNIYCKYVKNLKNWLWQRKYILTYRGLHETSNKVVNENFSRKKIHESFICISRMTFVNINNIETVKACQGYFSLNYPAFKCRNV